MREALWALDAIELEWLGAARSSRLRETLQDAMTASPGSWNKYYLSSGRQLALDQEYSLSDRIRYYWPVPAVDAALERLARELGGKPAAAHAVEPIFAAAIRGRARRTAAVRALASWCCMPCRHVLQQYAAACAPAS